MQSLISHWYQLATEGSKNGPWSGAEGAGCVQAAGAGLGEATPLHVSCHLASDGTKLETAAARPPPAVVGAHCADPHQVPKLHCSLICAISRRD